MNFLNEIAQLTEEQAGSCLRTSAIEDKTQMGASEKATEFESLEALIFSSDQRPICCFKPPIKVSSSNCLRLAINTLASSPAV